MKKSIFLAPLMSCLLLMTGIAVVSVQADEAKETISIRGKVSWDGYKNSFGPIVVRAVDKDYNEIASSEIRSPGKYTLTVPKQAGQIRLGLNLKDSNIGTVTKVEYSIDNPLNAGSNNITGANMRVDQVNISLMHNYKDEVVKISGNATFEGYSGKGRIRIHLTKDFVGINKSQIQKVIDKPGEYSIEVPKNFGPAYIWAVFLSPSETSFAKEIKVDIKDSDIDNIDLIIQPR